MKNSFLWKWNFSSLSCLIFLFYSSFMSWRVEKNEKQIVSIYKNLHMHEKRKNTSNDSCLCVSCCEFSSRKQIPCCVVVSDVFFALSSLTCCASKKKAWKTQTKLKGGNLLRVSHTPQFLRREITFLRWVQTKFICQMKLGKRHKLVLEGFCGRM